MNNLHPKKIATRYYSYSIKPSIKPRLIHCLPQIKPQTRFRRCPVLSSLCDPLLPLSASPPPHHLPLHRSIAILSLSSATIICVTTIPVTADADFPFHRSPRPCLTLSTTWPGSPSRPRPFHRRISSPPTPNHTATAPHLIGSLLCRRHHLCPSPPQTLTSLHQPASPAPPPSLTAGVLSPDLCHRSQRPPIRPLLQFPAVVDPSNTFVSLLYATVSTAAINTSNYRPNLNQL